MYINSCFPPISCFIMLGSLVKTFICVQDYSGHVVIPQEKICMPKYTVSNVNHIIDADEFKALYNHCNSLRDEVWIVTLWLTGARPQELIEMTKKDVKVEPEKIRFQIKTKKIKMDGNFIVQKRTLILNLQSDSRYIKSIERHLSRLKDDSLLFQFTQRTGHNIVKRLGWGVLGIGLCPYNFRHSRMTLLAEKGITIDNLMRFKGARSKRSVSPYLHARKVEYSVEMEV